MSSPAAYGPKITGQARHTKKTPAAIKLGRPPAFLSLASLALELDVAEAEIQALVERGIITKPCILPGGFVRWEWEPVRMSLHALAGGSVVMQDPYLAGARNATSSR